jgi:two-component SAPR family response regulator
MCLMLQAPDQAQELFNQALKIFEENEDVVGMFLTLSGMGESLAYRFDTFVLYDQWIETLELLLDRYPDFPSTEIESRITLVMLTAIALRQPSYSCADKWRNRALSLLNKQKKLEDSIRINILNGLILERTLTGHLSEAELLISSFKNSITNQAVPPVVIINLKNFEALHSWRNGNSRKCIEAASKGLTLAKKSGVHIISFIMLVNGAVGSLIDGNLKQADISLGSLESQLDQAGSYGRLLYHFTKAWRYLTENLWNEALAQCRHALKFTRSVGNPEASAVSHLAHSIALRASGEIEHAESELEKAIDLCESYPLHQIAFGCYLTKADVYFSSGNEVHGRAALRKGLSIGNRMGYTMFPLWIDDMVSNLCVRALESGIHEEYVQKLIKQRKLCPPRQAVNLESWPWNLKIYCLGHFKINIDGEVLKFKKKTQQKPLELLKVLIALGGRDVSESRISDILWPDADGDMQRQSFNTTLHRLRRILKVDDILLLTAGVLNLNRKKCWTDVWAFRHLVSESEMFHQPDKMRSRVTLIARKAITHYRGFFLPSEDEGWAVATREKLHGHYLSLIEGLAEQFADSKQWHEAIDLYEKGLEVEPATTRFYYQLMQCHSHLGHTASALHVRNRYLKEFGADRNQVFLDIQELYQKINGVTSS